MFCSECGKEISEKAVSCPFCGCATNKFNENKKDNEPIIINNNNSTSSSASSSAAASAGVKIKRHHSLAFDIFMLIITGGLWGIWMIFRPKYY